MDLDWQKFAIDHFDDLQRISKGDEELWDEVIDRLPTIFQHYDPERGVPPEKYALLSLHLYVRKKIKKNKTRASRFPNVETMPEKSVACSCLHVDNREAGFKLLQQCKSELSGEEYYILYYRVIEDYSIADISNAIGKSRSQTLRIFQKTLRIVAKIADNKGIKAY